MAPRLFAWQAWHFVTSTSLCATGVALCDIHFHFAWQVWSWSRPPFTLPARRGTYGIGLALVARMVTRWRGGPAALCVAGAALGDMHPSLCVAGVALGNIHPSLCLAGVALGDIHLSLCAAGVALADIDCFFAWQAWHLWHFGPTIQT